MYTKFIRQYPDHFKVAMLFPPLCQQELRDSHMTSENNDILFLESIARFLPSSLKLVLPYVLYQVPLIRLPVSLGQTLIGIALTLLPRMLQMVCAFFFLLKWFSIQKKNPLDNMHVWNLVFAVECTTLFLFKSRKIIIACGWIVWYFGLLLGGPYLLFK